MYPIQFEEDRRRAEECRHAIKENFLIEKENFDKEEHYFMSATYQPIETVED